MNTAVYLNVLKLISVYTFCIKIYATVNEIDLEM